jgi:dihydroflavonol-4-reductase
VEGLDIQVVEGNVLDLNALRRAMAGVEVVYHLAGLISIMPGTDALVERVNVVGTQNVVQASMEAGVRRLVYTSSIHAIKRVPGEIVIDESIPFDPVGIGSAYDSSKAIATIEVLEAVEKGLDAVVVCPTGVIGPYDYRRSEMGQLIFDTAKARVQFSVDGAYDFVDVRDVANGLILACQRGRIGEHYILSGERITISKLLATVREQVGLRAIQLNIPMRLAKLAAVIAAPFYRLTNIMPRFTEYALETVVSNSNISHAKATRELGYSPRPIKLSIADTLNWLKENSHLLLHPKRQVRVPVRSKPR